jgi:hypothetical protein
MRSERCIKEKSEAKTFDNTRAREAAFMLLGLEG